MLNYLKALSHVTFTCQDFPATRSFYRDTLGMKELFLLPYNEIILNGFKGPYDITGLNPGELWISYIQVAPRQFIELFNLPHNGENDPRNVAFHHFSLQVENITEAAQELAAKGVTLYNGPTWQNNPMDPQDVAKYEQQGSFSFFIHDPEGNEIEMIQYTAKSRQT